MVVPEQTGLLPETIGVAGRGLMTTVVVAAVLVQPFTVAVTLYIPAFKELTLFITGSCVAYIVPSGAVQLYIAVGTGDADKFRLAASQTGELLPATGGEGMVFTVTVVEAVELVQPFTVTVTE
jgi:hypothetical protein